MKLCNRCGGNLPLNPYKGLQESIWPVCDDCYELLLSRELREDLRRKDLKRGKNWLGITDKHKHGAVGEIKRKRGRR